MATVRGVGVDRYTRVDAAVFVSGVASMGLESLAGRVVAPQFRSSIYTSGTITRLSTACSSPWSASGT